MSDQAAVTDPLDPAFDWREREKKRQEDREARDKANRKDPAFVEFFEAYADAAGKRAAGVLYAVARELKKRPVLREMLRDTARELDTLFFVVPEWPDVKKRLEEGSDRGKQIRNLLGQMPEILAEADQQGQVALATIVAKRDSIDRMWTRYEAQRAGDDETVAAEKARLWEQADTATDELNELVLRLISEGKVPARKAAMAALGRVEINVDAIGRAREEGAEV